MEEVVLSVMGRLLVGFFVNSLLTVQGAAFARGCTHPSVHLRHNGGDGIAVRSFEFREVFAEALAPDLRIGDSRSYHRAFDGSRISGEETASGIEVHYESC